MKTFSYYPFPQEAVANFVATSKPVLNSNFRIIRGEEDVGWVDIYFNYNNVKFSITLSLALEDLSELVEFFENIININEETSLFLDDELISEPLLYAEPIDNDNIRLLIADHKRVHDNWKNYGIEYNSQISNYDIKCDVIVNKKKLLKEFYRAIKNIIRNCTIYEEGMYNICYPFWKDNLRNIISYIR